MSTRTTRNFPQNVQGCSDAYPLRTGPFDRYGSAGEVATGWTVGGVGWYRKSFRRPEVASRGKVEVQFEGVYMNSSVWINGVHLGDHPYGYTPFTFDLTPHLKDGKNVLAVRVNNPKEMGSFRQPRRNTYHGSCLAIVRPRGKAGRIQVRASSMALQSAQISLEVS